MSKKLAKRLLVEIEYSDLAQLKIICNLDNDFEVHDDDVIVERDALRESLEKNQLTRDNNNLIAMSILLFFASSENSRKAKKLAQWLCDY